MHVHILTKVLEQKMAEWDMHAEPLWGGHVCMQLYKGWSRCGETGGHTCADACVHLNQGVGQDEG